MASRGRAKLGLKLAQLKKTARDKVIRAVEEAVRPHHAQQRAWLEQAIAELRAEVLQKMDDTDRSDAEARAAAERRVLDRISDLEHRHRRDIDYANEEAALRSTAEFIRTELPMAKSFPDPHSTLAHGLSLAPSGGMALEFGVYSGTTLKIIAEARESSEVYGFDSFDGLPEDWRTGFPAGAFRVDGLPDVPGAELVVGWFDETLPGFLAEHPGHVDFLHVDCDLYSSAKTVLDLVGPRLRVGSVIVFDEFFNYPGWQNDESQAWREYAERTGTQFSYEAYTVDHEQLVVVVTALGRAQTG